MHEYAAHIEQLRRASTTEQEVTDANSTAVVLERVIPSPENFGRWLRIRRKAAKLSRADLARLLGVSIQAVAKWEQNKAAPTLPAVMGLLSIPLNPKKNLPNTMKWLKLLAGKHKPQPDE
jgi:DNA-binding transcriptional regulator YiaG